MTSPSVWNAKTFIFIIVALLLVILFYLLFNYDELRSRGQSCHGDDHCHPDLFCSFQAQDDLGKCAYKINEGVTAIGYPCYALNECPSNGYCSSLSYCLPGPGQKQGQACQYNSDCLLGNYCDCHGYCHPQTFGIISEDFSNYLVVPHSNLFINYEKDKVILSNGGTNPHLQTSYNGNTKIFTVTNVQGQVSFWTITSDDKLQLSDTEGSPIFLEIYAEDDHQRQFCLKTATGNKAYYSHDNDIVFSAQEKSGQQLLLLQETSFYA